MGKHRKQDPKETAEPEEIRIGEAPSLGDLVQGDVPVDPETGEPTAPSNPDLFGYDPFYDRDERPRFAAWALALCLVVVLLIVGGVSWMFGKGEIDGSPVSSEKSVITRTATVTEQAPAVAGPTMRVTLKSQVTTTATTTVTRSAAPAPTIVRTQPALMIPAPTIFRTATPPTVTKTITTEVTGPAQCYRVRQGVIVAEIDCP